MLDDILQKIKRNSLRQQVRQLVAGTSCFRQLVAKGDVLFMFDAKAILALKNS